MHLLNREIWWLPPRDSPLWSNLFGASVLVFFLCQVGTVPEACVETVRGLLPHALGDWLGTIAAIVGMLSGKAGWSWAPAPRNNGNGSPKKE
jgi:hypothetical protein